MDGRPELRGPVRENALGAGLRDEDQLRYVDVEHPEVEALDPGEVG